MTIIFYRALLKATQKKFFIDILGIISYNIPPAIGKKLRAGNAK
jgi:hypothetical protein